MGLLFPLGCYNVVVSMGGLATVVLPLQTGLCSYLAPCCYDVLPTLCSVDYSLSAAFASSPWYCPGLLLRLGFYSGVVAMCGLVTVALPQSAHLCSSLAPSCCVAAVMSYCRH